MATWKQWAPCRAGGGRGVTPGAGPLMRIAMTIGIPTAAAVTVAVAAALPALESWCSLP
jgi:hypothetical protein